MPTAARSLALAALLLAGAAPLAAQGGTVRPGDEVRMEVRARGEVRGSFAFLEADSVVLRTASGARLAIPAGEVGTVVVRRPNPREHGLVLGLSYGAMAGGVAGTVVGATAIRGRFDNDCDVAPESDACDEGWGTVVGAVSGFALGAVVGGVWGTMRPGSRWRPARLPREEAAALPSLHFAPARGGGTAVGVSLRF